MADTDTITITQADIDAWAAEVASIERQITQLTKRSDIYRKKIDAARLIFAAHSLKEADNG